jgi:hypothetical protein
MSNLTTRIDDALNPIVIKELRQAVNGKFVAAVLMLFLLISVIAIAIAMISMDGGGGGMDAGAGVLMGLQGILIGTCLLFLPSYAAIRLAGEYNDNNVDLMFITTIKPRAIIWGKLLSTSIVVVLIYATCMPFMTLTYLLRGVDLPSIAMVLALGFGAVIGAAQLAIFAACVTTTRGFRVLLGLGLLASLGGIFGMTMGGSFSIVQFGAASMGDGWEFWAILGTFAGFLIAAIVLLYTWSVALISPPMSNRMLPVRITMLIVWLAASAILIAWGLVEKDNDPFEIWIICSSLYFGLMALISICERTEWSPRIRRTLPDMLVARLFKMLFYSGAAGGIGLAAVMMGVMLVAAKAFETLVNFNFDDDVYLIAIGLFLYCYCYGMTGMLVRKMGLSGIVKQEHTWALAFVLAAVGCTFPLLMGYIFFDARLGGTFQMLANPLALADNGSSRTSALVFTTIWAIIVTAISMPWIGRQIVNFRPLDDDASTTPAA